MCASQGSDAEMENTMLKYDVPILPAPFVGRVEQLQLLRRIHSQHRHWNHPFVVTGAPGTGKTTLIAAFLEQEKRVDDTFWINLELRPNIDEALMALDGRVRGDRGVEIVVVDGADSETDEELEILFRRIRNYKRIQSVFILTRRLLKLGDLGKGPVLNLNTANNSTARELIERGLKIDMTPDQLNRDRLGPGKSASSKHPRSIVKQRGSGGARKTSHWQLV